MPRYYFDVVEAGETAPDEFGVELAGDDDAREEALDLVHEIARGCPSQGDSREIVVQARNERGEVVYEAGLALNGLWGPGRRRG